MSLLFYLNKQNNEKGINGFLVFLSEFSRHSTKDIVILCESTADHEMLNLRTKNIRIKTIIDVYGEPIDQVDEHYKDSALLYPNFSYNIEPTRFAKRNDVSSKLSLIYNLYNFIIKDYKIEACHFAIFGGIFRSVGIVHLQEVLNEKGIPSYMFFNTPVKGRFSLYDGIYLNNDRFNSDYNLSISNGVNKTIFGDIDAYFKEYIDFKEQQHVPFMIERRDTKLKKRYHPKGLVISLLNFVKHLSNSNRKLSKKNFQTRNSERPYILYLLSKSNQWYSSYANPELLDRQHIIRNLLLNLPCGYDLLLKNHPHVRFDYGLEKFISTMHDCYIYYDKPTTIDLVRDAEIVVSSGTTAGVEALMQKKRVIELGKKPPYFNFDNPPVKRVENLADLKEAIEESLSEEPPVNKIYAYFYALLKNSYPYNDNPNEITLNRNEDAYKKMAYVLVERMRESKLTAAI